MPTPRPRRFVSLAALAVRVGADGIRQPDAPATVTNPDAETLRSAREVWADVRAVFRGPPTDDLPRPRPQL